MSVVFLIAVLSGLFYFRPREMKDRREWEENGGHDAEPEGDDDEARAASPDPA